MAKRQSSLLSTWSKSKKVLKSSQTVSSTETEDEVESRPTIPHAADHRVRMLTVSPIDPRVTNEGLFRSNEDERIGLNEAEHMRRDHDESSMDEAEFRTAESYVSNKEDAVATDKDVCVLVEDEDMPSDADLTDDCNSVSEENQHGLPVISVDLDQSAPPSEELACQAICCSNSAVYQPSDKKILATLANQRRNFMVNWYKSHPWLTVCNTQKKVFCFYCRYATQQKLLNFDKRSESTFTTTGFNNWKKALEKFRKHSVSITHHEAEMKWQQLQQPSISNKLNSQLQSVQASRRCALLKQLKAIKYLLRQGIAVRGHTEIEGNLYQLLLMLANDSVDMKKWIHEGKYMSHEIINEQMCIMSNNLLWLILTKIKSHSPFWYSVIGDESSDIANKEQFNLSIRWVNDLYETFEDPVGLYCLPNTTTDTIAKVVKDILIRCDLPLSLCRGQAYDGAANKSGIRTGVSTRIQKETPAALPVHCFAHSLNLCLQDAGRQIVIIRDALGTVKDISFKTPLV